MSMKKKAVIMTEIIDIFAHSVSTTVEEYEDSGVPVFIITGKDWDENSFRIYLREDEVKSLINELTFLVY